MSSPHLLAVLLSTLALIPFVGAEGLASGSSGCGESPAYTVGEPVTGTLEYGGYTRSFMTYFPDTYDPSVPMPLVLSLHGWGGTSLEDACDSGLTAVAASTGEFITVHPQGMQDYPKGNPSNWGSWHFNGSTSNGGLSCNSKTSYCYTSNTNCTACDWTTAVDDVSFLSALYDHFESTSCIDTSREYVTGMSNGGMMAYQIAASLAARLAAAAPVAGSLHWEYPVRPSVPLPLMDIHGTRDTSVPSNGTGEGRTTDGTWYYYSTAWLEQDWAEVEQCSYGTNPVQFKTSWDGKDDLWCEAVCGASNPNLVWCAWDGRHQYYGGEGEVYIYNCDPTSLDETYSSNGFLVWEFLSQFSRTAEGGILRSEPSRYGPATEMSSAHKLP